MKKQEPIWIRLGFLKNSSFYLPKYKFILEEIHCPETISMLDCDQYDILYRGWFYILVQQRIGVDGYPFLPVFFPKWRRVIGGWKS